MQQTTVVRTTSRIAMASDVAPLKLTTKSLDRRERVVAVTEVWSEMVYGDWIVAARLILQPDDLKLAITEWRVFPNEADRKPGTWSGELLGVTAKVPGPGLTSRLLRRMARAVPLLVAEDERSLRALLAGAGIDDTSMHQPTATSAGGKGRPKLPDLRYAQIAKAYVGALKRGSRRPVQDVAKRRRLSESTVRNMIHTARARQLLTAAEWGAPGGSLLPRAQKLLEENTATKRRRAKGGSGVTL
jgi:hypothetical protein